MTNNIRQLENYLFQYEHLLRAVPVNKWPVKPAPHQWSKKEILGHLIDSAYTNLRRFVVSQYEETPKLVYNQDKCVDISNYQQWPVNELIELWHALNKHIIVVWKNMPAAVTQRTCETAEVHTLEWLAADYNRHLAHHMNALLEKEEIPYTNSF